MRWLSDMLFRLRAVFDRRTMEQELEDEFAFHLAKQAEKYVAAGMDPAEARRRARIEFGGEERSKEDTRASWGVGALTDLAGDLRFAVRQLQKNPAFSALAALTLALGIGGTVALFSVVNGLMLRPLPYPDEDRVMSFWMDYNWRGEEFDLVREMPESFEKRSRVLQPGIHAATEGGSSIVLALVSSVELWDVLDAQPLLGRTFRPGEDRPGAEKFAAAPRLARERHGPGGGAQERLTGREARCQLSRSVAADRRVPPLPCAGRILSMQPTTQYAAQKGAKP
jgi:hypothetical protein